MSESFPILVGAALLVLLILTNSDPFFPDFKTGLLIGAGLVVFVMYPAYLRNHEQRIAHLERGDPLRESSVAHLSQPMQQSARPEARG